ncbi:probable serine/threonine-protein kinase clkA isoform X4 [Chironomus tepperi]|uniref:probable serine/threonine-protein kinase clkA isoform X4 n=1 Tax=Chironomus tepperi TaxID=113505 RepID=UPI00391F5F33
MKTMENFFIQGLLLSLTTQLVWTLAVNNDETRSQVPTSQGIVGTLYRSAALKASDKELIDPPGSSRGQRCVRCGTGSGYGAGYGGGVGYGTGYGNYADRYYDDYYYRDYYRGREDPQYYGGRDPYYGSTYGNYRDRNWYYQPESRYPDSRYYGYNRYDDRYYGRTSQTEYDPYNYNSYRGNERSYGYDQYYDRSYDRPYRGYYDNRNFRPYDETYRGTAGFDNSGRGYYFANEIENRPPFDPQTPPNYRPPPNQYPQSNFYEPAHRPLGPNSIYNKPSSSQSHHQYSPHTTPLIPPEFYQGKPAPPPSSSSSSSSSSSNTQTVSSNTIGVDSGGNSASNNNNKNNSNNELDNKDKASTSYGGRPQSLGSSYLFERTDDDANTGTGLNPPATSDTKKPESANLEMKSE